MPGPNRRKDKEAPARRTRIALAMRPGNTGEGARSALEHLHEQETIRGLNALLEDVADAPRDKHGEPPERG